MLKIQQRIFVVGCPRSGTTFLQTLIMSSNKVASFPESHFFDGLSRNFKSYKFLGRLTHIRYINSWLSRHYPFISSPIFSLNRLTLSRSFILQLDKIALSKNRMIWLEKTPDHVLHIRDIKSTVPSAKFVHIIRPAVEVVPSLMLSSRAWGSPLCVEDAFKHWVRCMSETLQYCTNDPDHICISYNDLAGLDDATLENVESFLGIKMNVRSDLTVYAQQVVTEKETWKERNINSDGYNKTDKFSLLSYSDQQVLLNAINNLNLIGSVK